jgi:hypothetical protein
MEGDGKTPGPGLAFSASNSRSSANPSAAAAAPSVVVAGAVEVAPERSASAISAPPRAERSASAISAPPRAERSASAISAPPRAERTASALPRPPQPSAGKRIGVVLVTSAVVAGVVLAVLFWPAGQAPADSSGAPAATAPRLAEVAKVRVILDVPAVVDVDGAPQPAARETEVQVSARAPHKLAIRAPGGAVKNVAVPPLEPGEVHSVRLRIGE